MSIGGADLNVQGKITIDLVAHGLEAAGQSLKTIQAQAEKAGSSLRGLGDSFTAVGARMRGAGQSLSLGVSTPLLGLGALAVTAASDLNEAVNLTEKIFGSAGKTVVDWSTTTADAMGIAQSAALEAAANFGGLFQKAGQSSDQAAGLSEQIIGLGADLASAFNTDPAQALDALRSALIGESEPIRAYNVLLTEQAVAQEAVRLGLAASTSEVSEQAKVMARWSLIQQQTTAVSGDFTDTQDGLANATRRLKAQLLDTAAVMGQELLPFVLRATAGLKGLLARFRDFSPQLRRWVVVVLAAAAALGPVLVALGFVAQALGALAPVFALLLGPIGLVIAALVLLGIAYRANILGFGDAIRGLGELFRVFVRYIKAVNSDGDIMNDWLSHLPGPLQAVARLFGRLLNAIKKIGGGFVEMIRALLKGDLDRAFRKLRKTIAGVGDFLAAPLKAIGEFLKSITTGFRPLDRLVHTLGSLWIDFGRLIQEVFQGDFSGALTVGERILGRFKDVAVAAFGLIQAVVVQFVSRAFDWLKGAGVSMLAGFLQGAIDKLPDLLDWFAGLATTIWDTVTRAVGDIDWGTIWDTVVTELQAAAKEAGIMLDLVVTIGTLTWAGITDLWSWVKRQLAGGSISQDPASPMFGQQQELDLGDVAVVVSGVIVELAAGTKDAAANAIKAALGTIVVEPDWKMQLGIPTDVDFSAEWASADQRAKTVEHFLRDKIVPHLSWSMILRAPEILDPIKTANLVFAAVEGWVALYVVGHIPGVNLIIPTTIDFTLTAVQIAIDGLGAALQKGK
ncbi:MAG TPA: hypothetical protein VH475_22155, partial [Tepidisphaeraceae bacterium]